MAEMMKQIKDALYDEEVYNYIVTAVSRAKKATKAVGAVAEGKAIVEEFEALLATVRSGAKGEDIEALAARAGAEVCVCVCVCVCVRESDFMLLR